MHNPHGRSEAPSQAAIRRNCERLGLPLPMLAVRPGDFTNNTGARSVRNYGTVPVHGNVGSGTVLGYRDGRLGALLDASTSNNRLSFDHAQASSLSALIPGGTGLTVFCIVTPLRQTSLKDLSAVGIWNSRGAGGTNSYCLALNYQAGPSDYKPFFMVDIGGTMNQVNDPSTWSVGERLVLCGVRDGTSLKLYRAGVEVGSASCASGALTAPSGKYFQLGQIYTNSIHNTQAFYEAVLVFPSALSPSQIAALSVDYYPVFDPDEPQYSSRRVVLAGGGPGPGPGAGEIIAASGFFGV